MNPFNKLVKSEIEGRLESEARINEDSPIVVIKPEGETLTLSFIRSTKEYPFKQTIKYFLCYAKEKGYTRVKLEDDAFFSEGDCMYRALFYRAFRGKDSLYVDQGFKPLIDIKDEKKILEKTPVKIIKEIMDVEPNQEFQDLLNTATPDENNNSFGEWILEKGCENIRKFINKIDFIASKKKDTPPYKDLSNEAKQYLTAWRKYYEAHQVLEREPGCAEGGGGLRSRTRSSSRGKYQRRNTRKNRRHRKVSGGTRNTRK